MQYSTLIAHYGVDLASPTPNTGTLNVLYYKKDKALIGGQWATSARHVQCHPPIVLPPTAFLPLHPVARCELKMNSEQVNEPTNKHDGLPPSRGKYLV